MYTRIRHLESEHITHTDSVTHSQSSAGLALSTPPGQSQAVSGCLSLCAGSQSLLFRGKRHSVCVVGIDTPVCLCVLPAVSVSCA